MRCLIVIFFFTSFHLIGQKEVEFPSEFNNAIVLNNGKILKYEIVNANDFEIQYLNDKKQIKSIEMDKVFSYQKQSTPLKVMYVEDIEKGNDLTLGQMKKFVMGSIDSRNNYKGYPLFITGAALSYSAVFIDTYLFKQEANEMNESVNFPGSDYKPGAFKSEMSVFPIFVPLVFSLSTAIPKTRLREKHVHFSKYKEDTYYQMGFEKMARQKRVMNSLTGSLSGLLLGYLSYFVVNSIR